MSFKITHIHRLYYTKYEIGNVSIMGPEVTVFLNIEPIDKRLMRSISKDDFAKPRIRDPVVTSTHRDASKSILRFSSTGWRADFYHIYIQPIFFLFSFRPFAQTMMQLIYLWMHVRSAADPRGFLSNLKVPLRHNMNHAATRGNVLSLECYREFRKSLVNFTNAKLFHYTRIP